jgi:hypothetical protein
MIHDGMPTAALRSSGESCLKGEAEGDLLEGFGLVNNENALGSEGYDGQLS